MGGSRPHPLRGLFSLGLSLARGGVLSTVALVLAGLVTLTMLVVAFVVARAGGQAPLAELPSLTARILAWGIGVLLAFASGVQALRRDRAEGIRALVHSRGGSTRAYVLGRAFGLSALLAIVVGGGTLLVGIASTALSRGEAGRVAQGTLAALVYAVAFAIVVGPIALAALGARSRAGGYLLLLLVLVVPEMLQLWTSHLLPSGWEDLGSITGALGALRRALMPGATDLARFGRAFVVLGACVVAALAVVRSQVSRVDAESP